MLEVNTIDHPLAHDLALSIKEVKRLDRLSQDIARDPPKPVIERIETEDACIEIRETAKDKRFKFSDLEDGYKRFHDLLFKIPMRYVEPSLAYRNHRFIYHGFMFSVEDETYGWYYFKPGIRMVRSEKDSEELEITGTGDPLPILHLPEGWKLLIQSNIEQNGWGRPYQRRRDGANWGWDEEDGSDVVVGEKVSIYWRPELPTKPKILTPSLVGVESLQQYSRINSMTVEELKAIPDFLFETNVYLSDSIDLTTA